MLQIEPGDFVKAVFTDEKTGQSEWMWVKVQRADDELRVIFGRLDSDPVATDNLHLGAELAVSYDNIREHMKPSSFNQ